MSVNENKLNEVVDEEYSAFMDSLDADGVYLSGPIRCVDDNGVQWRDELIEDYPEIDFNNPLDKFTPEEHDILNDPIDFDDSSDKEQVFPVEYVLEDKLMINESDAIVLGLPEEIARGSCMESMYGVMRGVPLFVWTIDGQEESGWLYEHSELMSDDREEIMQGVKQCLSS